MSHNHAFAAIYDCVIADCSPYEFSGWWSRLRADAAAYRGPTDSAALLERLQRAFPLDTLQRSGVVRLGPSGAPELDPELHGPDSALLALRAAGSNAVLDLMTSRGCIARRSLPAIAILRDARTAQLLQHRSRPLCVSFSLPDVVLLRALGVPATLGTGLERLRRAGLKAFCRIFDLGRGPRALLSARGNRPDLLIAGESLPARQ